LTQPYSYFTIANSTEGLYKDKGSRFISMAFPVGCEEEVKQHLQEAKKKYFDARHHCYAYLIGADQKVVRANDDGEPHHTAGDPILGQLKNRNLTNVLVIVVRYFGGTKLGVSGLITAYREAAAEALSRAEIIEKEVTVPLYITYDYHATPEVMRLVKEFAITIESQEFTDQGSLRGSVSLRNQMPLLEKMNLLKALGHSIFIDKSFQK
jgi:uncharacterized YigZ family protein